MKIPFSQIIFVIATCYVLFLSSIAAANSNPSFDCTKAKTEIEEMICKSQVLSSLDRELSEIYATLHRTLEETEKADLKKAQVEWLKQRTKITDEGISSYETPEDLQTKKEAILIMDYKGRVAELKAKLDRAVDDASHEVMRPKLIMEELFSPKESKYSSRGDYRYKKKNEKKAWHKALANIGINDATKRSEDSWSSNCHYDTATAILRQIREELGVSSEYQKTWVRNQLRVFSACDGGKEIAPTLLSKEYKPERTQGDFLYQLASWYFYKGNYDKALDLYTACEKTEKSSVKPYAAYMVMRTLAHLDRATDAYEKALSILEDSSLKSVHDIAENYRFIMMNYTNPIEINVDLAEKHLLWLCSLIRVNPEYADNLEKSLLDYNDAMEQLDSYFSSDDPPHEWWIEMPDYTDTDRRQAVKRLAPHNELIDWMQAKKAYNVFDQDWLWALHQAENSYWSQNTAIVAHAWDRWKRGDGGEWLQIAAKRVHPLDTLAPEIVKAAMPFFTRECKNETQEYRDWIFDLWNSSVRIHLGRDEDKEALTLIRDHVNFRDLLYETWGMINSRYGRSLSNVLRWLFYTGKPAEARECLVIATKLFPADFQHYRALLAAKWSDVPMTFEGSHYFDVASDEKSLWQRITNVLPAKVLYELADNKKVENDNRELFIRAAFTRAIILDYDDDILDKFAILASKLHPSMKDQIIESVVNHDKDDAIDFLLRTPRFRPIPFSKSYPDDSIENDRAADEDPTIIDRYNHNDNNWWLRFDFNHLEGQILEAALVFPINNDHFSFNDRDNSEVTHYVEKQKTFLMQHPYKLLLDNNEIAALEAIPAAPQYLCEAVNSRESKFYWKFWQSEETRNKHAANLHYAVRTTRYGCNRCGSHEAYSRQAFKILHKQYGETTWAKATPYWFK